MNIGVLGTGNVGRTIAAALREKGHDVVLGSRDPKAREREPAGVPLATYAEAAEHGEILINAVVGHGVLEALGKAGEARIGAKILIDISNPLDFSKGFPPTLFVGSDDSLAERIQRAFPRARVVKTLNTVTASLMVAPTSLAGGEHDIFVCGNDPEARAEVAARLRDWWGWKHVVDLGDLGNARGMEAYLLLWVRMWKSFGTSRFSIRVVR